MRSVDRALGILRDRMRARGVLTVVDRVCAYHGCSLLEVASFDAEHLEARKDVFRALQDRGISMRQLADWFCCELEEVGDLLISSRSQLARIEAALVGPS